MDENNVEVVEAANAEVMNSMATSINPKTIALGAGILGAVVVGVVGLVIFRKHKKAQAVKVKHISNEEFVADEDE